MPRNPAPETHACKSDPCECQGAAPIICVAPPAEDSPAPTTCNKTRGGEAWLVTLISTSGSSHTLKNCIPVM